MKKIKARGQRYHSMDCYLQQVQCECGEIFEDWITEYAEKKFDKHKCKSEKPSNE